jgi:hypothetical protein
MRRQFTLLPINLDVLFRAAVADRNHDPEPDSNGDPDEGPCRADPLQHSQLPKRGQNATQQDDKSKEVHPRPFHFIRSQTSPALGHTMRHGATGSGERELYGTLPLPSFSSTLDFTFLAGEP